jgi:hypothetical protein
MPVALPYFRFIHDVNVTSGSLELFLLIHWFSYGVILKSVAFEPTNCIYWFLSDPCSSSAWYPAQSSYSFDSLPSVWHVECVSYLVHSCYSFDSSYPTSTFASHPVSLIQSIQMSSPGPSHLCSNGTKGDLAQHNGSFDITLLNNSMLSCVLPYDELKLSCMYNLGCHSNLGHRGQNPFKLAIILGSWMYCHKNGGTGRITDTTWSTTYL